jgi:hypothetical protein
MTRTPFGETQTLTIADLRVGDFLEVVPTQSGVRGLRVDSGILAVQDLDSDALAYERSPWRQIGSRRGQRVDARSIRVMRSDCSFSFPASFTCSVRRPSVTS